MKEKIVQTAGRNRLGSFAPEFAHFNDDVLFGENWNNEDLSLKTRSLITVIALMAQGITDSSLEFHIRNAKKHGVSKEEMVAAITHTAFYAGWPKAWAVFNLARNVYTDDEPALTERDRYQREIMFPIGEPNNAYAAYFDGQSYLASVSEEQVRIHNITFEPGCRNHWHIHHASAGGGQMLICVGGRGYYQEWGSDPVEMVPGTVIHIPANVKHWHGAAPDEWFSHLSFEIPGENAHNEWLESVDPAAYATLK